MDLTFQVALVVKSLPAKAGDARVTVADWKEDFFFLSLRELHKSSEDSPDVLKEVYLLLLRLL